MTLTLFLLPYQRNIWHREPIPFWNHIYHNSCAVHVRKHFWPTEFEGCQVLFSNFGNNMSECYHEFTSIVLYIVLKLKSWGFQNKYDWVWSGYHGNEAYDWLETMMNIPNQPIRSIASLLWQPDRNNNYFRKLQDIQGDSKKKYSKWNKH